MRDTRGLGRAKLSIWEYAIIRSQVFDDRLSGLPVVYADESHNTGENLLDENQPVFVVAGVHLDDCESLELVERVTSRLPDGLREPKYGKIARRPRTREALFQVLSSVQSESIRVSIANKRFMICSKIVDLGVEELTFGDGMNMLADGSARALANFLYLAGPTLGDRARFNAVLDTFVRAVMGRGDATEYENAAEFYIQSATDGVEWLRVGLLPKPGGLFISRAQ